MNLNETRCGATDTALLHWHFGCTSKKRAFRTTVDVPHFKN